MRSWSDLWRPANSLSATKYVALDVHQATTAASVRAETGQVIARTVLPTEGQALTEFFGGMRGAVPVAFEEGTQAQWLHDLLIPLVHRVVVCDRHGKSAMGIRAIGWTPTSSRPGWVAAGLEGATITSTISTRSALRRAGATWTRMNSWREN